MFGDIFLYFLYGILVVLHSVFSVFSFVIPDGIENSFTYIFDKLNYFRGIVDIPSLIQTFIFLLSFFFFFFSFKVILWIWALTPWIGKYAPMPKIDFD